MLRGREAGGAGRGRGGGLGLGMAGDYTMELLATISKLEGSEEFARDQEATEQEPSRLGPATDEARDEDATAAGLRGEVGELPDQLFAKEQFTTEALKGYLAAKCSSPAARRQGRPVRPPPCLPRSCLPPSPSWRTATRSAAI